MKPKAINVNVPEDVDRFFSEMARNEMTSKSAVVRRVLAEHVRQQEKSLQYVRRARKERPK